MSLIYIVLVLLVVGVLLWLINTYVPMAGSIKTILNAVVVICVILWLLKIFGLWGGRVPSLAPSGLGPRAVSSPGAAMTLVRDSKNFRCPAHPQPSMN